MATKSILPHYSKVIFAFNPDSKYYHIKEIERQETPINRLPDEFRIAPTGAAQIKCNADKMVLSRLVDKKYKFRTGIQETAHENWFLGNDFEGYGPNKKLSIILFHFIDEGQVLEVFYFFRYDKKNTFYRMAFANDIIPYLQKVAAI